MPTPQPIPIPIPTLKPPPNDSFNTPNLFPQIIHPDKLGKSSLLIILLFDLYFTYCLSCPFSIFPFCCTTSSGCAKKYFNFSSSASTVLSSYSTPVGGSKVNEENILIIWKLWLKPLGIVYCEIRDYRFLLPRCCGYYSFFSFFGWTTCNPFAQSPIFSSSWRFLFVLFYSINEVVLGYNPLQ